MSRRRASSDANYPSVYKHPSLPRKQQLCAICTLKTRGSTVEVHLTHGVSVFLCTATHATTEFMHANGGRDLAHLLSLVWRACNQLNANRRRALEAHIEGIERGATRDEAGLPGSYHRKATRNEAEHRYADGDDPRAVSRELRDRHAHDVADPPSERTLRHWFADGRWRRGVRTPLRPGFDRRDPALAARAQRRPATPARSRAARADSDAPARPSTAGSRRARPRAP
jgi:hypothetical protein